MREFAWLPVSWVDLSSRFLLHFPGACISVCVVIWSSLAVALEMIVPIRKLTPAEADRPAKKVPAIASLRGGTELQRPAQHRVSSLLAPASAVVSASTFAGTSGLQAFVSEQLQRGAPRTGPTGTALQPQIQRGHGAQPDCHFVDGVCRQLSRRQLLTAYLMIRVDLSFRVSSRCSLTEHPQLSSGICVA